MLSSKIKGPFYVYILFNKQTLKPFYAGSTKNPISRYSRHKTVLKKKHLSFAMAIYKKVGTREEAFMEENIVIRYLKDRFGNYIINKSMTANNYLPGKVKKKGYYKYRVEWVELTDENKRILFREPYWGECSHIAKLCGSTAERIRQVLIRKPDKIHPEIFKAIVAHRKIKVRNGFYRR